MDDVMLHFSNNSLQNALSKDQLKELCPMAFKSAPTNPNVSEHYVQANTETVIDDLATLGWYPVEAKQCRAKTGSKGIRSFHMIAFQNPDISIIKEDTKEIECYPRIILTNSHDGFNAFKFMVGLFRLVCSNGLVIATDEMVNLRIRHMNYTFEELRETIKVACKQVQEQTTIMSKMKNTQITDEEKYQLAENAIRIRKGVQEGEKFQVDRQALKDILFVHREEDKGNDLWNVFNVIQENMMKGNYSLTNAKGKVRKQRPISSVTKSLDVNVALFRSASRYIKEAA